MAAASIVVNTQTDPAAAIQWTDSAGGTAVTWWTPQLSAVTLAGLAKVQFSVKESSSAADVAVGIEIAVVNSDGSSPTIWGYWYYTREINHLAETTYVGYISGPDISIAAGQRIRIRLQIINEPSGMVTGYTATAYFNGASGGSGDCYVHFPVTLSENVAGKASPLIYPADAQIPALRHH